MTNATNARRHRDFHFRKTRLVYTGRGTHGSGFQTGNQIGTQTPTRGDPTRVPAGYLVPAVQHYLEVGILGLKMTDQDSILVTEQPLIDLNYKMLTRKIENLNRTSSKMLQGCFVGTIYNSGSNSVLSIPAKQPEMDKYG